MKKRLVFLSIVVLLMSFCGCNILTSSEPFSVGKEHQFSSSVGSINERESSTVSEKGILDAGSHTFSDSELDEAKEQTAFLIKHLVNYSFSESCLGGISSAEQFQPDDLTIFHFVCALAHKEEDEFFYSHYFKNDTPAFSNTEAYLPLSQVQKVVYQVFGIHEWFENPDDHFDFETQEYVIPLEIGPYTIYSYENLTVSVSDDGIVTAIFDLLDSELFPQENNYGTYSLTLQMIREDDQLFLRFVSFEPQ